MTNVIETEIKTLYVCTWREINGVNKIEKGKEKRKGRENKGKRERK